MGVEAWFGHHARTRSPFRMGKAMLTKLTIGNFKRFEEVEVEG